MKDVGNTMSFKKWMGFVAAIWVQSIAGNNYTFSNYSADLKAVMNLNQVQLNSLSVAKDVGKSFGVLAGLLADVLPPWAIFFIGSVVGLVGYGVQWLVVSQRINPLPLWQMAVALCLGGNSSTWMNCAVLVTCMRNFKGSRGSVTGILKGFIGLSTAIFTVLCSTLFTGDSSAFLLLLALLPAFVCFIAMVFLQPVPASASAKEDEEEQTNFMLINSMSTLLAVYLLSFATLTQFVHVGGVGNHLFAGGLLVFLLFPLVIPAKLYIQNACQRSTEKKRGHVADVKEPLLQNELVDGLQSEAIIPSSTSAESINNHDTNSTVSGSESVSDLLQKTKEGVIEAETERPKLGEEFTLWQAIQTFDFWLLFITFLCGIGTGITAMNNLGQMGEAQGFSDVAIFVSLTSIWGFFGRIAAGAISEHFVRSSAIPRPVWMGLSKILMMIGYLLLASAAPGSLYVGSIVVGLCYGVHITITVPTASEMFGLRNFGLLYSVLVLNIPLGSFLFSGLLAGYLYDREVSKTGASGFHRHAFGHGFSSWLHDEAVQKCSGAHCFSLICVIMACTCVVGLGLDIVLTLRLRPLYHSLRRKRAAILHSRVPQLS